jgi:hypothetical protein
MRPHADGDFEVCIYMYDDSGLHASDCNGSIDMIENLELISRRARFKKSSESRRNKLMWKIFMLILISLSSQSSSLCKPSQS